MATFANLNRRTAALAVGLVATLGLAPQWAAAQQFPTKPGAHHHPFPVGRPRWRGARWPTSSPKPGASRWWWKTAPAATASLRSMPSSAAPRMGMTSSCSTTCTWPPYPSLFKKLPYDTAKDFDPLLPLFPHLLLLHRGHQQPLQDRGRCGGRRQSAPRQTQLRLVVGGQPGAPGLRSCSRA